MPTTRPRIVVTETDEVNRALDAARRHWSDDASSPSRLLLRLIEEGRRAIAEEDRRADEHRRQVIRSNAGAGTGLFEDDYLDRLRQDWPV